MKIRDFTQLLFRWLSGSLEPAVSGTAQPSDQPALSGRHQPGRAEGLCSALPVAAGEKQPPVLS